MMLNNHIGEFAALATAFLWTGSALLLQNITKRVGSKVSNLYCLGGSLIILSIYNLISRGKVLPFDIDGNTWFWLSLSGLAGFVFGDFFLFKAIASIGSRIAMLIMALVPPLTAFMGWIFLGEMMSKQNLLGMIITLTGIAMVILKRPPSEPSEIPIGMLKTKKLQFSISITGLLFAFAGAVGQSVGIILSKKGLGHIPAFTAAQIRIITGVAGFSLLVTVFKRWNLAAEVMRTPKLLTNALGASFFGSFLGLSLSLLSIQYTTTGIASTIMALVPVLLIPPTVFLFHEKVTIKEIIGAIIAVTGTALFFM